MAKRNAASVFPDPVGADTSTSRRAAISGQASACGSVGSPKRSANQRATRGWKVSSKRRRLISPPGGLRRVGVVLVEPAHHVEEDAGEEREGPGHRAVVDRGLHPAAARRAASFTRADVSGTARS